MFANQYRGRPIISSSKEIIVDINLTLDLLKRFSNRLSVYYKANIKAQVSTSANHKRHKDPNEPIRVRRKYMLHVQSAVLRILTNKRLHKTHKDDTIVFN